MPLRQRQAMGDSVRQVVRANDIGRWISLQIRDLRDLLATPSATADSAIAGSSGVEGF
jgi:hypothetical protein